MAAPLRVLPNSARPVIERAVEIPITREQTLEPAVGWPFGAPAPLLRLRWDERGRIVEASGPARVLLGGRWDERGERRAGGTFASWRWDGARLEVRTDRLGFQPLFWAQQGNTLWLSPSVTAIVAAGAPAELDDAALAVFLRLGGFVGLDTAFRAVRALPPAAHMTWEDGFVELSGGRRTPQPIEVGRDEAIDRYAELFRASVLRDPVDPARVTVPLTGGRDSRHILLELVAAGRAPARALTVRPAPPMTTDDLRIAAMVAEAAGVRHVAVPTSSTRHADELLKNERTSLCALEHHWEVPITRWIEANAGARPVVFDGIGGDTLSEAKYMSPRRLEMLRRADLSTYVQEELGNDAALAVLLGRDGVRRFSRELAADRLAEELRTHLDAPNPVGSYRFWNRTRRTVGMAPFGMLSGVAEVRAPYLDHALVDFLSALPGEMLVDRTFHTTTIARAHPRFANLPYESAESPKQDATAYMRAWALDAVRWTPKQRRSGQALLQRGSCLARVTAFGTLPGYADRIGWIAQPATYLLQLEHAANAAR